MNTEHCTKTASFDCIWWIRSAKDIKVEGYLIYSCSRGFCDLYNLINRPVSLNIGLYDVNSAI
jgi:hypothetical protein